jgi:hypothetical protein
MKPGQGKMLIGRRWRLSNGELTDKLPSDSQERMNPEDEWLEAREIDENGVPSEGPIAEVTESAVRKMLDARGKPSRVIDGYRMVKYQGQLTNNENGEQVRTRTEFSPAAQQGAFDDATFEIVN